MQSVELGILFAIQNIRSPILDVIMKYFSASSNHGEIWILVGLLLASYYYRKNQNEKRKYYTQLYRIGEKRNRTVATGKESVLNVGVTVLIAILFSFIITNLSIKPIVMRLRPYEFVEGINLITGELSDYSFPSGHTSVSFAGAVAIMIWNRKWGVIALIVASIIAFSRMYLFVHWPTDVLAGVFVGIFCGVSAYFVHKFLHKKSH